MCSSNKMYSNGHFGVSALLAAPIVGGLVAMGLYTVAGVFGITVLLLSSFPDIDLKISFFTHRGFTHTIQFAVIVGVGLAGLFQAVVFLLQTNTQLIPLVKDILGIPLWHITATIGIGGFTGILFHLIGDVFTPTGINFFSSSSEYGRSLNMTKASNKASNAFINKAGVTTLAGGIVVGFNPTTNYIGGFFGLIVIVFFFWYIISKTRIGDILYK